MRDPLYVIVTWMLICVTVLSAGLAVAEARSSDDTIFVRLEKSGTQYVCTVDGKRLVSTTRNLPYADLDAALGSKIKDQGKTQTVAIVLSDEITLKDAFLARTVANKVGYATVRFFLLKQGAKAMSEIVIGSTFLPPADGQERQLLPVPK